MCMLQWSRKETSKKDGKTSFSNNLLCRFMPRFSSCFSNIVVCAQTKHHRAMWWRLRGEHDETKPNNLFATDNFSAKEKENNAGSEKGKSAQTLQKAAHTYAIACAAFVAPRDCHCVCGFDCSLACCLSFAGRLDIVSLFACANRYFAGMQIKRWRHFPLMKIPVFHSNLEKKRSRVNGKCMENPIPQHLLHMKWNIRLIGIFEKYMSNVR